MLLIGLVLAALAPDKKYLGRGVTQAQRPEAASDQESAPPATEARATDAYQGDRLIRQAAARLADWDSVDAEIRHRTRLFDQKLVGTGRYQQARGVHRPLVRLSLSVQGGESGINLLHVCDGQFLWLRDELDETPKLRRVDLQRVEQEARRLRLMPAELDPLLAGGGLPSLMAALETNFHFTAPQKLNYQGLPMWALAGHWRPERLQTLLTQQGPTADMTPGTTGPLTLPRQMPDRVFLLIGRDDLFPYHVDFRRGAPSAATSASLRDLRQKSDSLVTMELFEVQFNQPVDPLAFRYQPGDIQVSFRTESYIEQLRQLKRRERAK